MTTLLSNLFGFERPETDGEVIFFKLFELFVAVFTVRLAWSWGFYALGLREVVHPVGIAHYVDVDFLLGSPLALVNAALVTGLVVLGFFRATRYGYAGALLLLHLQYTARFSAGKAFHGANLLGMTLLGLSLAMLFFDGAAVRRRFALGFTYFFAGLGYTLAGLSKLVGTGITWADGRHLWMWIEEKRVDAFAKTGMLETHPLQVLALGDHALSTAILAFGLLAELCGFLLWWRRFRPPLVLALLGLHAGIYVVMNILFELSIYELVLLGFPWAAWIDRALGSAGGRALLGSLRRLSVRFA